MRPIIWAVTGRLRKQKSRSMSGFFLRGDPIR